MEILADLVNLVRHVMAMLILLDTLMIRGINIKAPAGMNTSDSNNFEASYYAFPLCALSRLSRLPFVLSSTF